MTTPIHFLFFSCGAHAAYLELAIRSLARIRSGFEGKIYVGEDPDDPLSMSDKAKLAASGFDITYVQWGKVTGYGETTMLSQLRAFHQVAAVTPKDHWIAKVDSDVLFVNDHIFRVIQHCLADLVGQSERAWGTFSYSQGGCYFVKAGFISRWADIGPNEVSSLTRDLLEKFHKVGRTKTKWVMPQCPEDAFFHNLVRLKGGRIRLLHYYLPLWQFSRLVCEGSHLGLRKPTLLQSVKSPRIAFGVWYHDVMLRMGRYSVLHFIGCKEQMPKLSKPVHAVPFQGGKGGCE
jgi:hypothetical protein